MQSNLTKNRAIGIKEKKPMATSKSKTAGAN